MGLPESGFHARLESGGTGAAPAVEVYTPVPEQARGAGLVVFAGGGYQTLSGHEGRGYALRFASAGFTVFNVRYRLGGEGHRHPAMLEDARAAVATVRRRAVEFGVEAGTLGVVGSSAGGHLAAHLSVGWRRFAAEGVSVRPAYTVLAYPVITMAGDGAHLGSRRNLLGEAPAQERLLECSCERQVDAGTPPAFIWHTAADAVVPVTHALDYARALAVHGVPHELHVPECGRHGLGLAAPFDWVGGCIAWIERRLAAGEAQNSNV